MIEFRRFDKVPYFYREMILSTINFFHELYRFEVKIVETRKMSRTYANFRYVTKRLGLNYDYFTNEGLLITKYLEDVKKGYHKPLEDTYRGIITHEIAHAIFDSSLSEKKFIVQYNDLFSEYKNALKICPNRDSLSVGMYSLKNVDEFVAECFANYYYGETCSLYSEKVVALLQRHFGIS